MPLAARTLVQALAVALLVFVPARTPGQQTAPQAPAPAFRATADVVLFDVSVLDDARLPVRGLTAADFRIVDEGVERPIASFAAVDLPTWSREAPAWMKEIASDVATNRRDEQRAVVILLDDFESGWDLGSRQLAKSTAFATIDALGPADLAAVIYAFHRQKGQEFTRDRALLRAAVDRFAPAGIKTEAPSKFSAAIPTGGLTTTPSIPSGACLHDCAQGAMKAAAGILGAWPGARKTLVLISPGRKASRLTQFLDESNETQSLFLALQRANVTVYQFDPHGLQSTPSDFSTFALFSDATGGRAVTGTNAPEKQVPQIFVENSSYYLLGLSALQTPQDGRFHRITIEVNRPGLHVRTRAGYFATPDRPTSASKTPTSSIDRALAGGLPSGDLPLALSAAPFAIAGRPGATVALCARVDDAAAFPPGTIMDFTAIAFDDKWKEVASVTQQIQLPSAGERLPVAETAMLLNLPPGRYEIRAAMRAQGDDRVGSVYASVTVPDFARDAISLSGVLLDRRGTGALVPDVDHVALGRTTSTRVFGTAESVAAIARVYRGASKAAAPVRVAARIVDAQDRVVATNEVTLGPEGFDAQRQAGYQFELPLERLAAGEYLLTIAASADSASARRDLRFTVR